jgi:hypothetical protein
MTPAFSARLKAGFQYIKKSKGSFGGSLSIKTINNTKLSVHFFHVNDEFQHFVGISPFIVIP